MARGMTVGGNSRPKTTPSRLDSSLWYVVAVVPNSHLPLGSLLLASSHVLMSPQRRTYILSTQLQVSNLMPSRCLPLLSRYQAERVNRRPSVDIGMMVGANYVAQSFDLLCDS